VTTSGHAKGYDIVKHVGVREFRDRATGYLKDSEPLAVERHGKLIGFYIPVEPERGTTEEEEFRKALGRLDETVRQVLEESGMTEDELADSFDLGKRGTASAEAGESLSGRRPGR
jgi:uncharacterized NAD(P)/FAD-binding protein YdhS